MKRLTLITLIMITAAAGLIAMQPTPVKVSGAAGYLNSDRIDRAPVSLVIFGAIIDLTHPAETGTGAWTPNGHPDVQAVSAHSYADGHYFYYLKVGDFVTAKMTDGTTRKYVVSRIEYLPKADENYYLFGGKSTSRFDILASVAVPDGIVLHTCWSENAGLGQVLGGIFIVLAPLPF